MEHPDVIREIDALVDSYNWEGVVDRPESFVNSLKLSFWTQKARIYLRPVNQEGNFVVFQLMLQFLEHPTIKHKGWILEVVSQLCYTSSTERRSPYWLRKVWLAHNKISLLYRYIRHSNPTYRIQAVIGVSLVANHLDRATNLLLESLSYEHSFQNIKEILNRIGSFFEWHRAQRIHPDTVQRLILQLEKLLKSKRPELRIEAAALYLKITQWQTPPQVTKVLIESWSQVDAYRRNHFMVLRSFEVWIYKVGPAKVLDLAATLLRNSRQFIVGLIIWEEIGENYFDFNGAMRRIVFSHEQKMFLEALLACKPLWRTRQMPVPKWHHRTAYIFDPRVWGIETTRATLYQQLKHARIVDNNEDVRGYRHPGADLPLQLDYRLLEGVER